MPKLTIIMPVYNEAEYIAFAIESVLSQRTTFPFVLLIIDDASTDATPDIIEHYINVVEQENRTNSCCRIIHIRQQRNSGKAYCMYTAYKLMKEYQQGGYFLVLDGDDFFTVRDKLQQQVTFLESNPQYFACGHKYFVLRALHNNMLSIASDYKLIPAYMEKVRQGVHNIEDYPDIYYYAHTSAMMYRNIFSDIDIPLYFRRPSMRGDSALLLWFCIMTKQRIGHIDMVGSCYNIHGEGIWSGIDIDEKKTITQKMFTNLISLTQDADYKEKLSGIQEMCLEILGNEKDITIDTSRIYVGIRDTLECLVDTIAQENITDRIYIAPAMDNLLESIGKVHMLQAGLYTFGKSYNSERVGILCSHSTDTEYLIKIYETIDLLQNQGKEVYVFYVCTSEEQAIACRQYCEHRNISFFSTLQSTKMLGGG